MAVELKLQDSNFMTFITMLPSKTYVLRQSVGLTEGQMTKDYKYVKEKQISFQSLTTCQATHTNAVLGMRKVSKMSENISLRFTSFEGQRQANRCALCWCQFHILQHVAVSHAVTAGASDQYHIISSTQICVRHSLLL